MTAAVSSTCSGACTLFKTHFVGPIERAYSTTAKAAVPQNAQPVFLRRLAIRTNIQTQKAMNVIPPITKMVLAMHAIIPP